MRSLVCFFFFILFSTAELFQGSKEGEGMVPRSNYVFVRYLRHYDAVLRDGRSVEWLKDCDMSFFFLVILAPLPSP